MELKPLSFLRIPVWPFGQVNVKWDAGEGVMFSEHYRLVPTFVVLGVRFTWRRRQMINRWTRGQIWTIAIMIMIAVIFAAHPWR